MKTEKEKRIELLRKEADKTLEYLEDLEERSDLASNKQARMLYKKHKTKLENIVDELGNLVKTESRNLDMMQKMEVRNTNEFEEILRGTETRALTVTADGAALIPVNTTQEILKKMEEVSPAFANSRKFPSVNGSLKVAKENDVITGGFFGEGESILEEALAFTEVTLTQKRIGAALSISNQLLNDSAVDLASYVNDLLGRRVAKTAEQAIFNGDGIKEFSGIMSDSAVKKVELSKAGALTIDALMDLYTSIHPSFVDGAAFYFSRPMFNILSKLKDGNGHFYLQSGVVNGKPQYMLFNSPVHVTEALSNGTIVGEVPAAFANLNQAYSILVKQEMGIRKIVDGPNALRGSVLTVLDGYMDGAVTNSQAISKLSIIA